MAGRPLFKGAPDRLRVRVNFIVTYGSRRVNLSIPYSIKTGSVSEIVLEHLLQDLLVKGIKSGEIRRRLMALWKTRSSVMIDDLADILGDNFVNYLLEDASGRGSGTLSYDEEAKSELRDVEGDRDIK